MSSYFDRDVVASKNFAKYFLPQPHEEREHAKKLRSCRTHEGNGLNAMQCALRLENSVNQTLLELHKLATEENDPHLCDFMETHYLNEQVTSIRELGEHVTNLRKMGAPEPGWLPIAVGGTSLVTEAAHACWGYLHLFSKLYQNICFHLYHSFK
ncbi:unnamed protein product [Nyctereutes procyonoides]|uniref:Ferritin n=1 Tax=Nyctereutes procyonoides TaxID=34880 RepID=A0A811Y748_NYCPR|nr:unnamed protein product [Nyctereutes procyonoides]